MSGAFLRLQIEMMFTKPLEDEGHMMAMIGSFMNPWNTEGPLANPYGMTQYS